MEMFSNPRKGGVNAINLNGDKLIDVELIEGSEEIILATKDGNALQVERHRVFVPSRPQKSGSSVFAPPPQWPCARPDAGDVAGTPSDKIPAIPGLGGWLPKRSESVYCAGGRPPHG